MTPENLAAIVFLSPCLSSLIFPLDTAFSKIWSFAGLAPLLILGIIAATAGACMLVAASVSWQASRVRPLDVLRHE